MLAIATATLIVSAASAQPAESLPPPDPVEILGEPADVAAPEPTGDAPPPALPASSPALAASSPVVSAPAEPMVAAGATHADPHADPHAPLPAAPTPARLEPEFSTVWYLTTLYGSKGGETFNRFSIGRGYLTVKLKPADWLHARMTLDAHQNDEGDWAMRLKYLYGLWRMGDAGDVVTDTNIEYGLVHTTWLDYEEHINHYRMQGTMFVERGGLFNSADLGVTLGGLLGPKLDEGYRKRVSKYYPGRWGSFAVGVYNGGGYHAAEANENKVVQGRMSLRPLGDLVPNLQLSYHGIFGKGNTEEAPDWRVHAGMASVEHEYFVVTATGTTGEGDQKGSRVDGAGNSLDFRGYSGFAEIKFPFAHASAIGRYDRFWWDWSGERTLRERVIGGLAYHFFDHNTVLVHYDRVNDRSTEPDEDAIALTVRLEIP